MKIQIHIPMNKEATIFSWDVEEEESEIILEKVTWDSDTGSLTGNERAVKFLTWAIDGSIGRQYGAEPCLYTVTAPLTNPSDMAHVLRQNGINLPNELLPYDVVWGFTQQYFEQWEEEQEYLARGETPPTVYY